MSNTSYFNPAMENQYLESEQFDNEIFEDGEFGNPEGIHEGIHMEGLNMEIPEMSYESGETWETTMEGDRFFGGLLRKFAPKIASVVGGALGGPVGSGIARKIASTVLREQEAEFNGEYVGEYTGESEAELEAILESSGVNMEILGEMAHYAELAAEATNEQEADRFIGAIANLAGQILPGLLGETQHEVSHEAIANEGIFEEESDRFLPLLGAAMPLIGKAAGALMPMAKKLLPQAVRGVTRAVQGIGRNIMRTPPPQRRQAMRALPTIAARTAVRTARALPRAAASVGAASPVPVSQIVAGAAARPIVETLASPTRLQSAVRRNGYWARQFRVTGTFSVTPMRRRYRR